MGGMRQSTSFRVSGSIGSIAVDDNPNEPRGIMTSFGYDRSDASGQGKSDPWMLLCIRSACTRFGPGLFRSVAERQSE